MERGAGVTRVDLAQGVKDRDDVGYWEKKDRRGQIWFDL